jgi:hypothetical protein
MGQAKEERLKYGRRAKHDLRESRQSRMGKVGTGDQS